MSKPRLPLDIEFLLESVLDETPDTVYNQDDLEVADYSDRDSVAFMLTSNFSAICPRGVHFDIVDALKFVYNNLDKLENDADLKDVLKLKFVKVANLQGLRKDLTSGAIADYFSKPKSSEKGVSIRKIPGTIAGRLWTKRKIISFWNDTKTVVKNWELVKDLFTENALTVGKIENYKVDWIERATSSYGNPMTPAASVTSDTKKDDPNQGDFIEKLFSDKNKLQSLSQEKLDKIVDKLHILPPEEKRKALMAMGYKNIKAIEIAEILGMTVAEFNNIMNVNESIKLSEIVKKLQK
jgi:hypothetical protein